MASSGDLSTLTSRLDVDIDEALLTVALTHRSWAYENGSEQTNERLEFLGDAVLGIVVTDAIYRDFPDAPEGQLARLRAAVVNTVSLADVARSIDLGRHILLGRGEETSAGHDKASILADTLEAVFGAVFVDRGFEVATAVVRRLMLPQIATASELGAGLDWKTSLQELAASRGWSSPTYDITSAGPDHARTFTAIAMVNGDACGTGVGTSKKQAEQQAAAEAFAALRE